MEFRFEATTKEGVQVFRVHSDSTSVTLSKYTGRNKNDEETWKSLSYHGSFSAAFVSALRHGINAFPGEVQEVLDAIRSMETSILDALSGLDEYFPQQHRARVREVLLKVDDTLKVLGTEDRVPQRQPLDRSAEEETTEAESEEEEEEFKLNF